MHRAQNRASRRGLNPPADERRPASHEYDPSTRQKLRALVAREGNDPGEPPVRSRLRRGRSALRGELAQARADLTECAERAQAAGFERLVFKAQHNLGYLEFLAGRLPLALARMEEAARSLPGPTRAIALLDLLKEQYAGSAERRFVDAFVQAAASVVREPPNLDFALAAVGRVLRLPPGAPLMLFAIGRTIGWIGQAIEQYATGQLIRPRARYVGPMPLGS